MSTSTYLFQLATFSYTTVFTSSFVRGSCSRTALVAAFNARQHSRCLITKCAHSNATPSQSSDSVDPSHPLDSNPSSSSAPENHLKPTAADPDINPSEESLLAAFESYIDEFEADAEEDLTPAEKRKAARERKEEEAREAYLKKLEVLTSLPLDLVVAPVKNTCPGCGTVLQSGWPDRPGYLPDDSAEDRLTKTVLTPDEDENGDPIPVEVVLKPRDPVCQRCYRLTHYGKIEPHLRVSTKKSRQGQELSQVGEKKPLSNELSPSKFRKVLESLRSLNAVFIYLVDIFDFHGTFVNSLRDIIGQKNPVLLAVNKTDLLPENYKASRVESWIQHECGALGLDELAGIHLISSMQGTGVKLLLADAMRSAKRRRSDIYVIGAANVGKSSFINQLIRIRQKDRDAQGSKVHSGKRGRKSSSNGAITTSVVPGTTLDVIRIPLGSNVNLFDTPGLMMPHQLTNYLDEKELRAVLPGKNVEHVSFRLGEGKALFIGGLARIEIMTGKPFFFTCFFSPNVKLHPGRIEEAEQFARRHVGEMLTPPFSAERFDSLGEWTSKSFTATGMGWKKASVDIVLSGLGWVSVTGPGSVRLRVCVPQGVGVFTREPLMPFEIQTGVSTYTGTNAVNRKQMKRATRKRKFARDEE